MTPDEKLRELIVRYTEGTATPEEIAYLESRYIQWNQNKKRSLSEEKLKTSDQLMWANVRERTNVQKLQKSAPIKLWPRIGIVAAVVTIIISAGIWFLKNPTKENPIQQSAAINDVAPGTIGATLTLASGKKIKLSEAGNGELANEAGISINKTADGQLVYEIKGADADPNKINTLSTAKGETYQVILPDGSMVYLNAASSLTYSANLIQHSQRRVKLSGEGYFEIFKDKEHPFIVESKGQEVEVLGTHFNVNAYNDEPFVKTTLLEGSVKIAGAGDEKILKPGQEAALRGGAINVSNVEVEDAVAWKNGYFMFDHETLESLLRKVARWYNVKIEYMNPEIKTETVYGTVSRSANISVVLKKLELTGEVKFKVESDKIIVSKTK